MPGFNAHQNGSATPAQPKQISSRLLNMKFMQRAAVSSSQKSNSIPSTPTGEPAAKRRRTGDFGNTARNLNSPSVPSPATSTSGYGDWAPNSGAFSAETDGISLRRGTNSYSTTEQETQWTLDIRLPTANGITNGTSRAQVDVGSDEEDDEDEEDEIWSSTAPRGRQTYGAFTKRKRKTTIDSNGAVREGTTSAPNSNTKSSKKRNRPGDDDDVDDDDLSSISDDDASDDLSSGEIDEQADMSSYPSSLRGKKQAKGRTGAFDFSSEQDLTRMDALDFHSAGFEHGFGRQRLGLAGGGGGSKVGGQAFESPGHGNQNYRHRRHHPETVHQSGRQQQKKKVRKTM